MKKIKDLTKQPFIAVSSVEARKLLPNLIYPADYPELIDLRCGEIGSDGTFRYYDWEHANEYARIAEYKLAVFHQTLHGVME